jgi:hypothetical protein
VRAERVTEDVDAVVLHVRPSSRPFDVVLNDLTREGTTVRSAQDARTTQMPMCAKCCRQPDGEWNVSEAASFRCRNEPVPIRVPHAELPVLEVHVLPLQCDHLAAP